MILTQTCEIAIRSVAYIAAEQDIAGYITVKKLSQSIDENPHTIAKVLQILAKQGLISSVKGASGGFYLTSSQLKKAVIKIVSAIDGAILFEKCILGLRSCSGKRPCHLHNNFIDVRNKIESSFNNTKIKDLQISFTNGKAFLV